MGLRRVLLRGFSIAAVAGILAATVRLGASDWPEWRGAGRIGVWNESGVVETLPSAGPKVAWRAPVRAGYSGPAVAGGRVFITDSQRIKANDAVERVIALDEQTGKVLWTQEWKTNYSGLFLVYAIGPRATPTVDGDRVYVLGAMGNLLALDVSTGRILWQKDFVKDFNVSVRKFPVNLSAMIFGYDVKPNFTVDNEAEISRPPTVDFGAPATPAPETAPATEPAPANN